MITISPAGVALKFGATLKFTASEPAYFMVKSQVGSSIDAKGNYRAGVSNNPQQTSASDIVSATALSPNGGSVQAEVTLTTTQLAPTPRSEEHTSELQSLRHLV